MFFLLFCISLLLYRKRKLFTLSKFFLLLRANNILFSNKLSKATFYIISLLSENKVSKLTISYRIIKLVILLLVTLSTTLYFYNKNITNFLEI